MRFKWWTVLLVAIVALMGSNLAQASGTYYRPGASVLGRYIGLEKGKYQISFDANFQHYGSVRKFDGSYVTPGDVRLRTYSVTGELGLSDKSSLYLVLPYVDNDADTASPMFAPESGFGDLKIGVNHVLSGNLGNGCSLIGTAEFNLPLRNYTTRKLTAPGDNSIDFLYHLAWHGDNLLKTPLFYTLGAGFKFRASQSPDQILWDAELGAKIGHIGTVSAFLDSITADTGLGLEGPGFAGDFATLKQTTTRLGARLRFRVANIDGHLYYAKAIQFQNQAPFDYYGIGISGHF